MSLPTLKNIYILLYDHFGKQNWWPAETPFEVIVGAILTQNTSWKNVEKSINTLKEKKLLSPDALYNLTNEELAFLIKSSGFYNLKAIRLKNFLNFFKTYNFDINNLKNADNIRKLLLAIKGIGKETADSIILYALNKPVFVVDAYTKRIFHRLGFIHSQKSDYDTVQNLFHSNLTKDANLFNEYHALIVETAKSYCRKKPLCALCPLNLICKYAKMNLKFKKTSKKECFVKLK